MVTNEEPEPCWSDCQSFQKLHAEVERLRKDQEDWRKGVDLIRGPLVKFAGKELPTLCCVTIANAVLEVCAEVERLRAADAANKALAEAVERLKENLRERDAEVERLRAALGDARASCYMRQQGCAPCGEDDQ